MSGAGSGAVIHWHHRTAVSTELLLSCTLVHDVVSVPMATVSKWVLYHHSMPTSCHVRSRHVTDPLNSCGT